MTKLPTTVLLIEDDLGILEIYKTILEAAGFQVKTITNGDEALPEIERGYAHFILLDLMIPGIPGIDILKKLRTDPKLRALPLQPKVVVITNVSDPDISKTATELGVDKYIIKADISAVDLPGILKSVAAEKPAGTS
jgi:DNA-binding response OmpR family regulator